MALDEIVWWRRTCCSHGITFGILHLNSYWVCFVLIVIIDLPEGDHRKDFDFVPAVVCLAYLNTTVAVILKTLNMGMLYPTMLSIASFLELVIFQYSYPHLDIFSLPSCFFVL